VKEIMSRIRSPRPRRAQVSLRRRARSSHLGDPWYNVCVARTQRTKKKQGKVPEPLIPIVDAVVEMVFERLAEAAARAKKTAGKKGSGRTKDTKRGAVGPSGAEHRGGLAGAVADLLLAGLTHPPAASGKAEKPSPKRRRRG
jgi:hypothetical protein